MVNNVQPLVRLLTKEIVVDFQRGLTQHPPLTIDGATVERVSSTKFLGVHISKDLAWTTNTASLAEKAQRHLYFLCKLKQASAPPSIMCTFYRGTIESILSSCITVLGDHECGRCKPPHTQSVQPPALWVGIGASVPAPPDSPTAFSTMLFGC